MTKNLLATFVALLTLGTYAPVSEADDHCTENTLGAVLESFGPGFDSNQNDFDIVREAVALFEDLTAAACDASEELTVFLPTDKAFRILMEDLGVGSFKDEAELFDEIATLLGTDGVYEVLTYHIAGGVLTSDIVVAAGDGYHVPTLNGETFELDFRGKKQIRLIDGAPNLRDPIVRIVDISADNGVAHVIDRVLLPPPAED